MSLRRTQLPHSSGQQMSSSLLATMVSFFYVSFTFARSADLMLRITAPNSIYVKLRTCSIDRASRELCVWGRQKVETAFWLALWELADDTVSWFQTVLTFHVGELFKSTFTVGTFYLHAARDGLLKQSLQKGYNERQMKDLCWCSPYTPLLVTRLNGSCRIVV